MSQAPGRLDALVATAARRRPAGRALVAVDAGVVTATWTWAELDVEVTAVARGLAGLAEPGERVALHLGHPAQLAIGLLAAVRAGLVAVPVDTTLTPAEVAHELALSGAGLLIGDRPTSAQAVSLLEEPPTHLGELPRLGTGRLRTSRTAIACVLFTSGTTGWPRGVVLTHAALLANLTQIEAVGLVGPDDTTLVALPLTHVQGLVIGLLVTAHQRATAILLPRFDPVEALEAVRAQGVTTVLGVPPMYVAWAMLPSLAEGFGEVRSALCGGAALPAEVLARIERATGRTVLEGYGMTETAGVLTVTRPGGQAPAGTVGRPLPGVTLRLLAQPAGPDAAADEVEAGAVGEVVVCGGNLLSGYLPEPAAGQEPWDGTLETLVGGPDSDGWWRTGDLAVREASGDVRLVDRLVTMVNVGGRDVMPAEVEAVLLAHPGIDQVAVIAIPHPYTGQAVRALVVRRPGATVTGDELIEFASQRLARWKCPTSVEMLAELPRTPTGKVARGRLRGLALQASDLATLGIAGTLLRRR